LEEEKEIKKLVSGSVFEKKCLDKEINIDYECFETLKSNNPDKFKLNLFYKEFNK